mmetsp:Transcript_20974/g.48447  ORF Transcript_20974/g.48447 Transcript_20974/m.48447 type:complete len:304 (+) Transcript_20974:351-1262(+)|eukprot:CAMPEP_0116834674 /NCGR_PEP_ID=MMETSP0418-20121206/7119_1 /TAXON_ID=1158023 /ORGANISM="Astrosyne radiata, Strain 13vi08-1A" /LENGTH=303 /DNA_ID=CAMNT_0004464253 /DNA_START=334 /DNA_END=1245 /DNA_ORIENTATION=+
MDANSGAAVAALICNEYNVSGKSSSGSLPCKGARLLDMCCAPGLKLCMMADLVPDALVVGVDVDPQRISLCKNIVEKYHVTTKEDEKDRSWIRLYRGDGVDFLKSCDTSELVFDSQVAQEEKAFAGSRKRKNKSARAREQKRLRQLASLDHAKAENDPNKTGESEVLFDFALVDAECSTDGSLKHVQHRMAKTGKLDNHQLTDESELQKLVHLQRRLLESGFRLLKAGGVLVYSTCSLSVAQNEEVVQWLLEHHSNAFIIPIAFSCGTEGNVSGTVRFLPSCKDDDGNIGGGGGLFVSKIGKR